MTLLISWVGVDPRGVASIYIASDSRISWNNFAKFDYGRKVFAFNNYPDILGYCGEVLFPSLVLGQIIEMGDNGLLFDKEFSCKQKFEAIKEKLIQIFREYPHEVAGLTKDSLQVIYASREPNNPRKFFCHIITWQRNSGWSGEKIDFPSESSVIFVGGSGKEEFDNNYSRYNELSNPNKKTSRNVFHCFCDTLFNIKDIHCGGAPQLVGIISKPQSNTKKIGIITQRKRFLFGSKVDDLKNFDNIEWRNDLFEICDGQTMRRFEEAQKQPNFLKRY